ncbi:MAG: terpene cyclase/mutase family protein [Chloroflexi bacterium]|nr:terpene cyclase/mutase family protein [Chloroflexota bacterium]
MNDFIFRIAHGVWRWSRRWATVGSSDARGALLLFPLLLTLSFTAMVTPAPDVQGPLVPSSVQPLLSPEREAAIQAALEWLLNQQQSDGGVSPNGDVNCEAAWAVVVAGQDPDGPAWTPGAMSLLDACETAAATLVSSGDAGRIAKALRAAAAVQADPRDFGGQDLIAALEALYDSTTGFYHPGNLFRQNLAVLALVEAGRPIPPEVIPAMLAQQRPNGEWGWPIDPTPGDGSPATGDVDTTGRTIHALVAAGLAPSHPAIVRAIRRLILSQNQDAAWGFSETHPISNADSTALAIEGLLAASWDPRANRFQKNGVHALQALLSFQDASGAFRWRKDIPGALMMATLQSIPVLAAPYPYDATTLHHAYFPTIENRVPSPHSRP